MLVAVALVPDTALLVPGAGGAATVVDDLRDAAHDAVRSALAARADRVVVVAPGRRDRELVGEVRGTLAAAGVPDHLLDVDVPRVSAGAAQAPDGPPPVRSRTSALVIDAAPPAPATAVALHLLAVAGWGGALRLVEVATTAPSPGPDPDPDGRGHSLRTLGAALVDDDVPTALVVVGSASGRHGPDAPLADDPRAPEHDARLLADLADPVAVARARLADDDPALAAELAVTGWAPWQVMLGAVADADLVAQTRITAVVGGAQHAAFVWLRR